MAVSLNTNSSSNMSSAGPVPTLETSALGFTFPVTVPSTFTGMSFNRWPTGSPLSPAPPANVSWGTSRTHDSNGINGWYQIETSAGVYSWTSLDAFITAHRTAGAAVMFTFYGTPAFYTSNVTADAYGAIGGKAYPNLDTNLVATKAFIAALINRYNIAGGAWRVSNPTLGKGIQFIECMNEADPGVGNWFIGTMPQLVDICNAVYTQTKALDSTIIVTSPGWGNGTINTSFYNTAGVLTANTGKQCCDGTAWHSYGYGICAGATQAEPLFGIYGALAQKTALATVGVSHPIYLTESGNPYNGSANVTGSNWANLHPTTRKIQIARILLLFAVAGVQMVNWYSYDSAFMYTYDGVTNFGPASDPNGVLAGISEIQKKVAGKTITGCKFFTTGPVTVYFNDGTSYSI
jgi:hypothetical protein